MGVVLILVTIVVRDQYRGLRSRTAIGWGVIAGLFVYLGIDDGTKLHERAGSVFKALVLIPRATPNLACWVGFTGFTQAIPGNCSLVPFLPRWGCSLSGSCSGSSRRCA